MKQLQEWYYTAKEHFFLWWYRNDFSARCPRHNVWCRKTVFCNSPAYICMLCTAENVTQCQERGTFGGFTFWFASDMNKNGETDTLVQIARQS